jgi:hypothetical protein
MEDHMKYAQTIKTIIVHPKGEPLFHESAIEVSLSDEGGGEFIALTQSPDVSEPDTVKIDPGELDQVYLAAKLLLTQHKSNGN